MSLTTTLVGEESKATAEQTHRSPLELKGALEHVQHFDVTPTIGREFVDVNLKDWLRAPNSDELLRDLAITSEEAFQKFRQAC